MAFAMHSRVTTLKIVLKQFNGLIHGRNNVDSLMHATKAVVKGS